MDACTGDCNASEAAEQEHDGYDKRLNKLAEEEVNSSVLVGEFGRRLRLLIPRITL